MSAMEKWDDDAFVRLMIDVLPQQTMTNELAAQEAIADHCTEQQAERMGMYECL
ncbi:hypothetical protein QQF21_17610 [Lelliottia sp. V89_10]|uniref:hypothetical protein n=1 Tax=Lelliottia wanjuensis TaxID=3050585 RepID=UPI00249E9A7C|nr:MULTISPECIES: hypothetical protein [unclassified Lelliottia]MDI3361191.1 hypothetical protein [Lelliottia sp. V89_13]MDK9551290.1 hypothetical protein [Lelliottia sp. V89_5]MDK9597438.1 hypothetical protein [Lelliottia sp. V89_10]